MSDPMPGDARPKPGIPPPPPPPRPSKATAHVQAVCRFCAATIEEDDGWFTVDGGSAFCDWRVVADLHVHRPSANPTYPPGPDPNGPPKPQPVPVPGAVLVGAGYRT